MSFDLLLCHFRPRLFPVQEELWRKHLERVADEDYYRVDLGGFSDREDCSVLLLEPEGWVVLLVIGVWN